ncbi:MAG: hypothetical protein ACRDNP_00570 [Gaiellaceae bacterium]
MGLFVIFPHTLARAARLGNGALEVCAAAPARYAASSTKGRSAFASRMCSIVRQRNPVQADRRIPKCYDRFTDGYSAVMTNTDGPDRCVCVHGTT